MFRFKLMICVNAAREKRKDVGNQKRRLAVLLNEDKRSFTLSASEYILFLCVNMIKIEEYINFIVLRLRNLIESKYL